MNTTKTMRLPPRRLITTPGSSPRPSLRPNKRKDREDVDEADQLSLTAKVSKPALHSNQLLAGYLAHEFLTNGTLFGQPRDHPGSASAAEPLEKCQAELHLQNYHSYVEVSNLFKHRGAHFEGIVNPTQLARLLNL